MGMTMVPSTARRQEKRKQAPRLSVTSLPSLDPVQSASLTGFFDTVYAIAARLVQADEQALSATAA